MTAVPTQSAGQLLIALGAKFSFSKRENKVSQSSKPRATGDERAGTRAAAARAFRCAPGRIAGVLTTTASIQ
jgi:hypothetical protein